MNSEQRLACQVRLCDIHDAPRGCGIICGPRHVLTCTHVVQDCLGGPVTKGATVVARFPVAAAHRARLVVRDCCPVAVDAKDAEGWLARDLCLLELQDGDTLPKDSSAATAMRGVLADDLSVWALGLGKLKDRHGGLSDEIGAVGLRGTLGEYEDGSRRLVAFGDEETAVRPGCSGAGAFGPGGLIGMIVEMQEKRTGFIAPLAALNRLWNFALATPALGGAAVAAPRAAGTPPQRRWIDAFEEFDRSDQVAHFRSAFKTNWQDASQALICAIAGLDADLPLSCRDRLRLTLRPFLERQGFSFRRFLAEEIAWPARERFDVACEFDRICNVLALHVGAEDAAPDSIRQGLNAMLQPTVFFSMIEQRHWGRRHILLLQQWGDLLRQVSAARLDKPCIHFMILRLDANQIDHAAVEPTRRLRRFYADALADVNGDILPPRLVGTQMLNDFMLDNVETWVDRIGAEMDLDDERIDSIKTQARLTLPVAGRFRLDAIDNWIRQIA